MSANRNIYNRSWCAQAPLIGPRHAVRRRGPCVHLEATHHQVRERSEQRHHARTHKNLPETCHIPSGSAEASKQHKFKSKPRNARYPKTSHNQKRRNASKSSCSRLIQTQESHRSADQLQHPSFISTWKQLTAMRMLTWTWQRWRFLGASQRMGTFTQWRKEEAAETGLYHAGHTREEGRLGKKHVGGIESSADDTDASRRLNAPLVTECNGG